MVDVDQPRSLVAIGRELLTKRERQQITALQQRIQELERARGRLNTQDAEATDALLQAFGLGEICKVSGDSLKSQNLFMIFFESQNFTF